MTYDHPLSGFSGVSMYCRDLFAALVDRGVAVACLCTQHRDWRLRPYLRTHGESSVQLFELVNSPIDPAKSLHHPGQDVRQPAVERILSRSLDRFRPDIMHVHTLLGYPGSIFAVAKARGVKTIVTLHDFWTLCPRMTLVRVDDSICDGPAGGLNCVQHCVRPVSWQQQAFRLGTRLPEGALRGAFSSARSAYVRWRRPMSSVWSPSRTLPARPDDRLLARHANRSRLLVEAVAAAGYRIAVSEFVRSIFARNGLTADSIRTIPLALAFQNIPRKRRELSRLPLRFAMLGRASPLKGAHVFAAAIRGISNQRAQFLLHGSATPEARRHLQGLAGETPIEFRGPYRRDDLPRILDEVDVVVVPSVAQETVGLVTLEAQAAGVPVIASRVGAIPEFVRDGENGLLFTPGDPSDLREKMLRIIETPSLVAELSRQTRPPMSLAEHVDALVGIYASCLAQDPGR